jgi:hypothetical protein
LRLRRLRPAPVARSTTPSPASGHGEPPVKGSVALVPSTVMLPGRVEVTPWIATFPVVVVARNPGVPVGTVVVSPMTLNVVVLVVVDELVDVEELDVVDEDVVVGIDVDVEVGASVVVVVHSQCLCDVVVTGSVVEVVVQPHWSFHVVVVWLQPLLIAPAS